MMSNMLVDQSSSLATTQNLEVEMENRTVCTSGNCITLFRNVVSSVLMDYFVDSTEIENKGLRNDIFNTEVSINEHINHITVRVYSILKFIKRNALRCTPSKVCLLLLCWISFDTCLEPKLWRAQSVQKQFPCTEKTWYEQAIELPERLNCETQVFISV